MLQKEQLNLHYEDRVKPQQVFSKQDPISEEPGGGCFLTTGCTSPLLTRVGRPALGFPD